jgi:hypothetical protein
MSESGLEQIMTMMERRRRHRVSCRECAGALPAARIEAQKAGRSRRRCPVKDVQRTGLCAIAPGELSYLVVGTSHVLDI